MSARWGRDWIKFYLYPSAEWELLPLSVRALGNEILRAAGRNEGQIALGENSFEALCRLIGIHPHERKRARADLELLTKDGFCSIDENGTLTVRNFAIAQGAVAPVTERVRASRARASSRDDAAMTQRRSVDDAAKAGSASDPTPRKDTTENVTETTLEKTETERREDPSSPVGEEGGVGETIPPTPPTDKTQNTLPGIAPSAPKRKRSAKKQPTPDPEPLQGSVAKQVRDAIVADSVLAPITNGPGDFAIRSCAEGAYPGVDVLAEVRRAGEYAARFPGKYRDGRSFLSGWLRRAAEDFARKPRPAGLQPAAPSTAFTAATTAGKPVPGQLAMQRFYPTRAKTAEGEQS